MASKNDHSYHKQNDIPQLLSIKRIEFKRIDNDRNECILTLECGFLGIIQYKYYTAKNDERITIKHLALRKRFRQLMMKTATLFSIPEGEESIDEIQVYRTEQKWYI